jgi:GTP-binding protein Era
MQENNILTKSGFVALVGRPNAGKSTLMNWVLEEKIALVSHKANATRRRMNAIVMHNDDQVIFVDTPGLHEKEKMLNQYMMDEALKAIGDCDIIVFLAPVTDSIKYYEEFLSLNKKNTQHIILLTKADNVSNAILLKRLEEYACLQEHYLSIMPFSVKKGYKPKNLLDELVKYLPISPYLFDPEDLTTEKVRDIYKEFIREAIFELLSDEIPYETDVLIDSINEKKKIPEIRATIIVEKTSQKGMIIGKGGQTIKRIGKVSREKIEAFTRTQIYLSLFVSIKKGWSKNKQVLSDLGYEID